MNRQQIINENLEDLIVDLEGIDAIGRYMVNILPSCTELGVQIIERTERIFKITGSYDENFKSDRDKAA